MLFGEKILLFASVMLIKRNLICCKRDYIRFILAAWYCHHHIYLVNNSLIVYALNILVLILKIKIYTFLHNDLNPIEQSWSLTSQPM